MITAIIEHVIRFKWIVVCAVAALIGLSIYSLRSAALDAIPDISDPQIIVYVKWPRSSAVIEREVTEPVIRALFGSPDIRALRGTSHMGYSFVYAILEDPGRRTEVRQFVADRLNAIRGQRGVADQDELYWNATGHDWEVPIRQTSVTVTGPAGVVDHACYQGPDGSTDGCDTVEADGGRVTATGSDLNSNDLLAATK